ncbi:hypothetical protein [Bradyrhizobium roseum]|uniref:hypothetical protein n=1 Tax=Bradyrhizobium roseum TaxID=3056648 RepID=UPI0026257E47|nr:hypothetical protein [Bradyrhizobium roseus]WKA26387.1 hypothetical protein QUH67_22625 [Bradyrhizobium roseus]
MEALRNYAQHRDLPVHILASKRGPNRKEVGLGFQAVPKLDLLRLSQDQAFKRSVLTELAQYKRSTALTPFVRDYIRQLAKVHRQFRFLSKELKDDWNATIGRGLAEFIGSGRFRRPPREIWAVAKEQHRLVQTIDLFYSARSYGLEENTRQVSKIAHQNLSW